MCAEGVQLLGKGLICCIDHDPRRIKTEDSGGMHIIENQPVGPVRACPPRIGHAVCAALVGILLGSVKDNPVGNQGIGTLAALVLRNNAETGQIVGFKLGDIFRGQFGDVSVAKNGIPTINDVQSPFRSQLLKVMERHKGKVKMRQKGITLVFNPYEPLLCRRQSCLQLAHARNTRIFHNSIRRHHTLTCLAYKLEVWRFRSLEV